MIKLYILFRQKNVVKKLKSVSYLVKRKGEMVYNVELFYNDEVREFVLSGN